MANEAEYAALIQTFKTAILTTKGPDGHYHSRPMATQEMEPRDALWFATNEGSEKCRDIQHDAQVALTFHASERDSTYLSVSGQAELVRDRQKIHEMWNAGWKPWFPDGPDQADLVLIRVTPEHVEWQHPEGGKLQVLATMLKRTITGSRELPAEKQTLDIR